MNTKEILSPEWHASELLRMVNPTLRHFSDGGFDAWGAKTHLNMLETSELRAILAVVEAQKRAYGPIIVAGIAPPYNEVIKTLNDRIKSDEMFFDGNSDLYSDDKINSFLDNSSFDSMGAADMAAPSNEFDNFDLDFGFELSDDVINDFLMHDNFCSLGAADMAAPLNDISSFGNFEFNSNKELSNEKSIDLGAAMSAAPKMKIEIEQVDLDFSLLKPREREKKKDTINAPQNGKIPTPLSAPQIEHIEANQHTPKSNPLSAPQNKNGVDETRETLSAPQINEKLFGVDATLSAPQINVDEIIDAIHPTKKQMWVHECARNLSYPDTKIKHKMIVFMRDLARRADRIVEQLYKGRVLSYIEIGFRDFDLIDKNGHEWIKSYLAQMGIAPRDHSYSTEHGRSIKYYINDISIFEKMKLIDVDDDLQKTNRRIQKKILKKRIDKMNSHETLTLLGNAFLANHLPSIEAVKASAPDGTDKTKDNINAYGNILKYGVSVPKMGEWHRCYSNAQNIPRWIRGLTGLVEVDTKASQPNLLLYMAHKDGYISDEQYTMYSGDVYTYLLAELPRAEAKKELTEVYLSNTIGAMQASRAYSIIQAKIPNLNGYAENLKKWNEIAKSDSYKNLSRRLTQLESTIIYKAMSIAWMQGIDCAYLYDALLTIPSHAEKLTEILNGVFAEFGVLTWAECKPK